MSLLKLLSWPVVVLLCAITAATAFTLVPRERGSHEGYLFTLASYVAMSSTIVLAAIFDRMRPGVFQLGKALHYRFWLACTSVISLLLFLVLRVFPIPVWEVPPMLLILSYSSLFIIALVCAWFIAKTKPKQSQ